MNIFYIRVIFALLFLTNLVYPQKLSIDKIEPPNWWAGMKWNQVQLMFYGTNLSDALVSFEDSRIAVLKVYRIDNPDYLFVDIKLPESIESGNYEISLINESDEINYDFPIYQRESNVGRYQGFDASDVIYLITPDRFVNGDTSNDEMPDMIPDFEPDHHLGRHGGDIKGIISKLDYLDDLGITAIWINPLLENNNDISYHGYAATDLYKIDPRFGTNDLYKELIDEAHKRGLKIIYDHVSNHISINHPWIKNLPASDWINGAPGNHLSAIHHKMSLSDIHADSSTIINLTKGWFVDTMPDLNQENPFVKNYLIQNTLWWIESTGLDGIREDTYPYADQKFLSEWASAIFDEYPNFNIVGEVWTGQPAFLASFQKGSYLPRAFDTNLPSVTDFGMRDVYYKFLKGENNLYNVYETLAMDHLYPDPDNLVVFIDNHDVTRTMLAAEGDINKVKIALTLLLTTRGIPQILYGTEIGMEGGEDHGLLRADFPGGFPDDVRNAFTSEGRTEKENEIFNFIKHILELRKYHPALSVGKLTHFPTQNEVFVYFKSYESNVIMAVVNNSDQKTYLELQDYKNFIKNGDKLKCLFSGKTYEVENSTQIENNANVLLFEIFNTQD